MYRCEHRPNLGVALYGRRHWIAICLAAHKFAYWSWPFCLNFLYFSQTAGDSCWLRALSQLLTTRCFLSVSNEFRRIRLEQGRWSLGHFCYFRPVRDWSKVTWPRVIGQRPVSWLFEGEKSNFHFDNAARRVARIYFVYSYADKVRDVTGGHRPMGGQLFTWRQIWNFSIQPLLGPWRWWQHFPHGCSNRMPVAINRLCVSGWVSRRRRESITERVNRKNYRHVQMSSDKASGSTTWTVYLKSTNHSLPPICFRVFYSINSHQF